MAIFQSADTLYDVLEQVFQRVQQDPQHTESFTSSNLVIRMRFTDLSAEVLLDGRQPPMEVFFGRRPGRADLEMSMRSKDLHAIWMGQRRLKDAFLSGQIRTKGNVFRAMQLTELFRAAEAAYPAVLAEKGLL